VDDLKILTSMITDVLDKQTGILMVTLDGNIILDDLLSWLSSITPARIGLRTVKFLGDAFNANYCFSRTDLNTIRIAGETLCCQFEVIKCALLHNKPRETAYSTLIANAMISANYTHQIFSEKDHAIKWLLEDSKVFSLPS
jgi:hypothetical protein